MKKQILKGVKIKLIILVKLKTNKNHYRQEFGYCSLPIP